MSSKEEIDGDFTELSVVWFRETSSIDPYSLRRFKPESTVVFYLLRSNKLWSLMVKITVVSLSDDSEPSTGSVCFVLLCCNVNLLFRNWLHICLVSRCWSHLVTSWCRFGSIRRSGNFLQCKQSQPYRVKQLKHKDRTVNVTDEGRSLCFHFSVSVV